MGSWLKGIAALAVLLAIGLGAQPARSEAISIAMVSRTVFFAPLWIAATKGFFKEEGVDVTLEILDNAEKINDALRTGRSQVAVSSTEALVSEAYTGGSFRVIASVACKPPHYVIAKPGTRTPADLKGARFGVLSMHEGTTFLVQDMAKSIGLKPDDYTLEAVGGAPTRWRLLQEGRIDVGLQPFPLSYESEALGFSNLGPILRFVPDYEFTTVFVDPAWANAHRATTLGVLRAMKRGQDFMRSNGDEAAAILQAELRTSADLARRALRDVLDLGIMPDGLVPSEPGLRAVFAMLQEHSLVPRQASYDRSRIVDDSFLQQAR